MNLFVGNLSFSATENDVKALFEAYGAVASVRIKKKSGKNSRGFGFVTMPDDLQAQSALSALQEKDFLGALYRSALNVPNLLNLKKTIRKSKD